MGKSVNKLSILLDSIQHNSDEGFLITSANIEGFEKHNGIKANSRKHFYLISSEELIKAKSSKRKIYTSSGTTSIVIDDCMSILTLKKLERQDNISITLVTDLKNISEEKSFIADNIFYDFIHISSKEAKTITQQDWRSAIELKNIMKRKRRLDKKSKKSVDIILIDKTYGAEMQNKLACSIFSISQKTTIIAPSKINKLNPEISKEIDIEDSVCVPDQSINTENPKSYLPTLKGDMLWENRVTAIINVFKREDTGIEIYNSLREQSYPISDIIFWINQGSGIKTYEYIKANAPNANIVFCDENLGVWARFAHALNTKTEFTVIFDDDTIPGKRWIENCMEQMNRIEALYGTVGLIYNSENHYLDNKRYGWPSANSSSIQVDIVGHSWFFKTNWLKQYWIEKEDISGLDFCGEDMHFSYALQKIGIPTFVPPHPIEDKELWGSIKGYEKGSGKEAISISGKGSMMDYPLKQLIKRGFKLLKSGD